MKKSFMKTKDGRDLFLLLSSYRNNDRLYIGIEDENGELESDFTINLSDLEDELPSNMCVFVSNDLPDDIYKGMLDKNMLSDVLDEYQYNIGKYKMIQIFPLAMKDYITYEEYEKYLLSSENECYEVYNERITDLEDKLDGTNFFFHIILQRSRYIRCV